MKINPLLCKFWAVSCLIAHSSTTTAFATTATAITYINNNNNNNVAVASTELFSWYWKFQRRRKNEILRSNYKNNHHQHNSRTNSEDGINDESSIRNKKRSTRRSWWVSKQTSTKTSFLCSRPRRVVEEPTAKKNKHKDTRRMTSSSHSSMVLLLGIRGGSSETDSLVVDNFTTTRKPFFIHVEWNKNTRRKDHDPPFNTLNNDDTDVEEILLPDQAVIVMDAFCQYHGQYVAEQILEKERHIDEEEPEESSMDPKRKKRTAVIYVCSNYLAEYILSKQQQQQASQEEDVTIESEERSSKIPRIPNTPTEADQWLQQLYQTIGLNATTTTTIPIRSIYCESDSGLHDAEQLRMLLNVDCQDEPTVFTGRRNKYQMHQAIATPTIQPTTMLLSEMDSSNNCILDDGIENDIISVPEQKLCTSLEEALEFARNQLSKRYDYNHDDCNDDKNDTYMNNKIKNKNSDNHYNKVVVKPIRGVASELVFLCSTEQEVIHAYQSIVTSKVFASLDLSTNHTTVLVQEYIRGQEFAVDVVSYNGTHKIAALWQYDKRPCTTTSSNSGSGSFCYYQTKLVDSNSIGRDRTETIYNAVRVALDRLGIKWGFTHSEFIVPSSSQRRNSSNDNTVPVLIEVNCRQHNMDFCPLTMACIGYNALDMTIATMVLDPEQFDLYPHEPQLIRAHGCMVHLVNSQRGIVRKVRYLQEMEQLESTLNYEIYERFLEPGTFIEPTIDIRTDAGWIQLIHPDPDIVQQDYETIVSFMPTMFQVE